MASMKPEVFDPPGRILLADPQKCTGCRWCEIVCSIWHTGASNPAWARIRVLPCGPDAPGVFLPVHCQQCADAPCAAVCPKDAISRDAAGVVCIDYERCVACRSCVYACPYGAMGFDPERSRVFKCDLCGGQPQCVAFCPAAALCFDDATELQRSRMGRAAGLLINALRRSSG